MFAGREASFYAGWGPHMSGQVHEASSRTAALSHSTLRVAALPRPCVTLAMLWLECSFWAYG